MAKLVWDKTGEHYYETGSDKCALFPIEKGSGTYGAGVAWNGFRGLTENRTGADETALYANNKKYLGIRSTEEFGGTITAYTYPDEWEQCDGSASPVKGVHIGQQPRVPFGLVYRTYVGNDTTGSDYDYKLHIVYNATASPSNREYATIDDSPDAVEFSWDFTTTPVEVEGYKPTSHIEIDSRNVDPAKLKAFEETIYGSESAEPKLPTPAEVFAAFATASSEGGH